MVDTPERIWTDDECHFETRNPHRRHAVEYVRADLYEQVKRELEVCQHDNASYKSTVDHLKQRAEAAERLAGARVVEGEIYNCTCGGTEQSGHTFGCRRIQESAALAEPAGEVEPEALRKWREDQLERVRDGSFLLRTTPPYASSIREAATQLLSAIDTGCGREEIISQTGPLRAALAGAKP